MLLLDAKFISSFVRWTIGLSTQVAETQQQATRPSSALISSVSCYRPAQQLPPFPFPSPSHVSGRRVATPIPPNPRRRLALADDALTDPPSDAAVVKTSSQQPSHSRSPARDGNPEPSTAESPQSPALSTTSTADCDSESSPVLPPLPAPTLPGRALELLRTPPNEPENDEYVTASWGSPYPDNYQGHLREKSVSSEASDESSEDSPIHQLDINTPFLRPPPGLADQTEYAFVSASVLANRARRQARGLTEHWIRQHTASDLEEARLWLSDGTEEEEEEGEEPSSLSGSVSSDLGWLEPHDLLTPRANPDHANPRRASRRHQRTRSSVETLTPEALARMTGSPPRKMANLNQDQSSAEVVAEELKGLSPTVSPVEEEIQTPATPSKVVTGQEQEAKMPKPPSKHSPSAKANNPPAHRPKKKVPWKGKNIMVLLPVDNERGQPGKAPMPLSQKESQKMWESWAELGYDTRGFDLNHDNSQTECQSSQSRAFWPSHAEMAREHFDRKFTVTLPDLNGE